MLLYGSGTRNRTQISGVQNHCNMPLYDTGIVESDRILTYTFQYCLPASSWATDSRYKSLVEPTCPYSFNGELIAVPYAIIKTHISSTFLRSVLELGSRIAGTGLVCVTSQHIRFSRSSYVCFNYGWPGGSRYLNLSVKSRLLFL